MSNRTVYRCKQGMACGVNGKRHHFAEGALVFGDHPVQPARHPNFEPIEEYVERTSTRAPFRRTPTESVVEEATAVPGEKRRGIFNRTKTADQPAPPEKPPASGPGSGADAWRKYAARVTDSPAESWASLSRDEIIELLSSEGAHDGQA